VVAQIFGVAPSGPTGWAEMSPGLIVPTFTCMAIALFVGAGAPGARGLAQSVGRVAPQWLQYGICLFLLSVLSTVGSERFIYGQF
jgi:hypothetical protein